MNEVPDYHVPGNNQLTLGLPAHKVVAMGHFPIFGDLSINPQVIWLSDRYTCSSYDANFSCNVLPSSQTRIDPVTLINANVAYDNLLIPGFRATLAVSNALNSGFSFIQAYGGGHGPLPAYSREIWLRLSYDFSLIGR
jgi:hypothetical protein